MIYFIVITSARKKKKQFKKIKYQKITIIFYSKITVIEKNITVTVSVFNKQL